MNQLVKDYDISAALRSSKLLEAMSYAGFQASELGRAVQVLKRMHADKDCLKFLAFTANMVASGLRGCIAQLVRKGLADVVVTTGGSIDHDVIKCFGDYELASFTEDDEKLYSRSVNRIGNILVDNKHYALLEKKVQPVLKKIYGRKKTVGVSELINEIARTLPDDRNSFLVQALRKKVFVYSPALVDSALGLQLYFFKQNHSDFALDETADLPAIAGAVLSAKRTGALVLGGGPSKHFTLGCNLLRGGLDYSVYVTTAQESDGSLSGAPPREAKSWGKIRRRAATAIVHADATLALPLMLAGVFGI